LSYALPQEYNKAHDLYEKALKQWKNKDFSYEITLKFLKNAYEELETELSDLKKSSRAKKMYI
jgi:hypothetical protein